MIDSYIFANGTWSLLDDAAVQLDIFYLPDTYIATPAGGSHLGVVLSEDDGKHTRYISLAEIVAMGLTNIAGLTAQFNTDKAAAEAGGVPVSSPGGTTTNPNIAIGLDSGSALLAGALDNVLIGRETGEAITTGDRNVIIGNQAGKDLIDGADNVIIGAGAGYNLTTPDRNVMIGRGAGYYATVGNGNIAIGYMAGKYLTGASQKNIVMGYRSGYAIAAGSGNIMFGYISGNSNTSGSDNVNIGYYSGGANTTGDKNVCIGWSAGSGNTASNKLFIANGASNPLIEGDFATGILQITSTMVLTPQTGVAILALTPVEGMMAVANATSGAITSTGLWVYEGAAWTKVTVV